MTRYLAIALLALVGGCQTFHAATSTVDLTAASKAAYSAKAAYDGLLVLAVAYNARPRCTEPRTVITCSDPAVVEQMRRASAAADAGTQAAENAVRTLGTSPTVISTAVTAAQQAVGAFKTITDLYSPKVN